MKSQLLPPLMDSSKTETYPESFINVHLKADYVTTVLPFLLSHHIPFSLSTIDKPIHNERNELKVLPNQPAVVNAEIRSSKSAKKITDIERIFQKYIVEGVENIPPKAEEIAAEIGLSLAQFKALFFKRYGKSFYSYYVNAKMDYAAALLQKGFNASEVSEKIGYAHSIKFNKMFQKYFGMTPKKYQMQKIK